MRHWDLATFIFYMFIGISIVITVYFVENYGRKHKLEKKRYNEFGYLCYICLFSFLTFIASFRYVNETIGGADALVYINYFKNPQDVYIGLTSILSLRQTEPLFFIFVKIIRLISSNYVVFFILYYGIIVYAYLRFISKHFDRRMNYMPLMYVVLPFLNSFNTMRSAMAMAITLLAFVSMTDGKEKKAIFLCIIAAGFHFTSLIVLVFIVFYKIINSKMINSKKWAIYILIATYAFFYFGSSIISSIIGSTKYHIYLGQNNSIIGQLIIIICGILSIIYFNPIKKIIKRDFLLWAVIFNVMMIPLMVKFGFFRLNNYFVFPRLLIWSYIIKILNNKFKTISERFPGIIDIIAFFITIAWTAFRISKDWYPEGVMPYFNILYK